MLSACWTRLISNGVSWALVYRVIFPRWHLQGYEIYCAAVLMLTWDQSNEDILLASGSITISGVASNVASYTFSNNSWTSLGSLPGPVTALAVDNLNSSSVFAAGRWAEVVEDGERLKFTIFSNGQSAFLSYFNGENWNSLGMIYSNIITQIKLILSIKRFFLECQ